MDVKGVSEALVAHCRNGTEAEALATLYSEECVSVEAFAMEPGQSPETKGLDGIRGKHAWWEENFEVHEAKVEGPHLHGDDRFAVIFEIDSTHKPSGMRSQANEVAVYHVADGKIVREEFFYAPMSG